MRTPLLEEKYHVKETEEGKFALELDGYIKKLDMEEMGYHLSGRADEARG